MYKKTARKFIAFLTAFILLTGYICLDLGTVNNLFNIGITVYAADGRLYDQRSRQWENVIHGTGHLSGPDWYDSGWSTGCGIFSFCNAVYALKDITLDPVAVADWAYSIGAYNRYGADGITSAALMYDKIEERYGAELGITMNGYFGIGHIYDGRLIEHLEKGGVAIGLVPGHYITITGYDRSTDSFKVIDGFVTNSRGLPACGWVSANMLNGGNRDSHVSWISLIGNDVPSNKIVTSNLNSPTIITTGDKATITGTISSQLDLTSISLWIANADQIDDPSSSRLSIFKTINGKYYNLASLGIDLGSFQPGVYKVLAEASNSDHSEIIFTNTLTVLANTNTGKNGTYIFRSAVDNSYVIGTNSDNNVQLSSGSDKLDCKWYVEYLKDGYYTIKNCASGLYLDIYSGGTAAGSNVWQYEGNQSEAQQWQILPSGNSYYLIPRCSLGCAADVDYSVMADGTNITIYYTDLYMGANQRFVLDDLRGSIHQYEHSISFYANGGELPSSSVDWSYYKADGVNTGRDVGNLIVYTIPGMTVDTNPYGYEIQVNKSGQVTARRLLGDSNQLIVPEGGMVISGHFNSGTDGGSFVSSINPNQHVGFDPASQAVYVYASEEEYAAHHKYVADGSSYGFLPTPSKEGYIFEGWYTSPTGGTKITESSIYSTDSLYAHWTTPVVTISGKYTYTGSPVIPNITVTVGDTILVNGTDYTVYYNNYTNAGTATYTIKALSGGRYSFPDITGTYVIQKAKASISDAPKAVMGLKYNGKEQTLITAGTALNGLMVYSFDGITYNENIPAATEPGTYTIFYKAQGSGNYTDSDIAQLTITIEKSNETIKSISVRSKYLYVIYGYSGSDEISRRENIAFDSATNDMIEWMYLNDSSCGLLSDFVNAFEAYSQSDSILLTNAQMKALEYVLSSDYGNTAA